MAYGSDQRALKNFEKQLKRHCNIQILKKVIQIDEITKEARN